MNSQREDHATPENNVANEGPWEVDFGHVCALEIDLSLTVTSRLVFRSRSG
jgi:hypothetical protein